MSKFEAHIFFNYLKWTNIFEVRIIKNHQPDLFFFAIFWNFLVGGSPQPTSPSGGPTLSRESTRKTKVCARSEYFASRVCSSAWKWAKFGRKSGFFPLKPGPACYNMRYNHESWNVVGNCHPLLVSKGICFSLSLCLSVSLSLCLSLSLSVSLSLSLFLVVSVSIDKQTYHMYVSYKCVYIYININCACMRCKMYVYKEA